jgi:hypothetical protein
MGVEIRALHSLEDAPGSCGSVLLVDDEPLLLRALQSQDMYLAGSILLIYCALTIIGTLISDILLAVLDPRIRTGGARA